jgi:uncharacterized protein YaaW (UPF0174 family)
MNKQKEKERHQIFEREDGVLQESKSLVEKAKNGEVEIAELLKEFQSLSDNYGLMLGEAKLLTSVSDRLQTKLNKANEAMQKKNLEMKDYSHFLSQTRIRSQATTITVFIMAFLFVISDQITMPILKDGGGMIGFAVFLAKIGIVASLKPLEKLLERLLINKDFEKKLAEKDKASDR